MGRNIAWREEWKRPYESIWSIIENIEISNSINIAKAIPFTCKCGFQLYQTFYEPVWMNWSLFEPILELSFLCDNYNYVENYLSILKPAWTNDTNLPT